MVSVNTEATGNSVPVNTEATGNSVPVNTEATGNSVLLRPIEAQGVGTRNLVKCAFASIFNNPSNLLGRDGLVSALGSSIMEDLSVIYAKHGAILVHGIFLDYSADGLEIDMDGRSQEESLKKYPEKIPIDSTKSREELVQWLYSASIQGKYSSEGYKTGTNNCIHFVYECCEFLGATIPQPVEDIMVKVKRYGWILDAEITPHLSGYNLNPSQGNRFINGLNPSQTNEPAAEQVQ